MQILFAYFRNRVAIFFKEDLDPMDCTIYIYFFSNVNFLRMGLG